MCSRVSTALMRKVGTLFRSLERRGIDRFKPQSPREIEVG